jgi:hypothetical protein
MGRDVPLITCMAAEKVRYAKPNAVLIDDNIDRMHEWIAKGGIFIHHTTVPSTIKMLGELGIIKTERA